MTDSEYHTVDYARHTEDNRVHLLDLEVTKSLCGLEGIFEIVPTSDAVDDGMCEVCDSADRPIYADDGSKIADSSATDTERSEETGQ